MLLNYNNTFLAKGCRIIPHKWLISDGKESKSFRSETHTRKKKKKIHISVSELIIYVLKLRLCLTKYPVLV